jgi:hypothetical protein
MPEHNRLRRYMIAWMASRRIASRQTRPCKLLWSGLHVTVDYFVACKAQERRA